MVASLDLNSPLLGRIAPGCPPGKGRAGNLLPSGSLSDLRGHSRILVTPQSVVVCGESQGFGATVSLQQ